MAEQTAAAAAAEEAAAAKWRLACIELIAYFWGNFPGQLRTWPMQHAYALCANAFKHKNTQKNKFNKYVYIKRNIYICKCKINKHA